MTMVPYVLSTSGYNIMDNVGYGDVGIHFHIFHSGDLAGYVVAKNSGPLGA